MYIWEFNTKGHEKIFDNTILALSQDPKTTLQIQFGMNLGHTDIHYLNETHPLQADRLISEKISGDGGFSSEEQMYQHVSDAIIRVAPQIKQWLQHQGRLDIEIQDDDIYIESNENEFVASVYLNRNVGQSFELIRDKNKRQVEGKNISILQKEAKAVRFVLQADNNRNNPVYSTQGFYLKTAYPDVHERHAEIVNEFTREEFLEEYEEIMPKSSNIDKLLFLMRDSDPDIRAFAKTDRDNQYRQELKLVQIGEDKKPIFEAFISTERIRIREYGPKQKVKNIEMDRLLAISPRMAGYVQKCAKYLIMMQQNKLADLAKSAGLKTISAEILMKQNDFITRLPKNPYI